MKQQLSKIVRASEESADELNDLLSDGWTVKKMKRFAVTTATTSRNDGRMLVILEKADPNNVLP